MIAGLTSLVYLPSLHGAFIIDDDRYLTENPLIASSQGLYSFWFTNRAPDYYPVSNSSLWLEWRFWGMHPSGYHVTNLILHIATSLLVWLILQRLLIPGGFLAALIFAVHPVNVETVAWIAQRKELLAAFFFMVSILLYLRAEETRRLMQGGINGWKATLRTERCYWLSLLVFTLAIFSKGTVGILPLVLLLIVWWLHRRITKWDCVRSLPFFCVGILASLANFSSRAWSQSHGDPIPHAPFLNRLAGAGAVIWFYLSKALFPINFSLYYPHWNIRTGNLLWWLPLVGGLSITAALLLQQRYAPQTNWSRPLLFAWGFYCVALLPVLGFAETGLMYYSLVADHYHHIAIIGVVAAAAAAWSVWRDRARGAIRSAATAVAIILVSISMLLTWNRACLFGDTVKLYQVTLARYHGPLPFLHNNLGVELEKSGRLQEALDHFQLAIRLKPDDPRSNLNLADTLLQVGRTEEAIEYYHQALRFQPDFLLRMITWASHCAIRGESKKQSTNIDRHWNLSRHMPRLISISESP